VEAAIISPLFFLLILGAMEFSLIYRDYLSVNDAAAEAAVTGAIQSKYPLTTGETADYSMMKVLRSDLAAIPYTSIDRIVIYKSTPPAAGAALATVPFSCKNGAFGAQPAAKCNVYDSYTAFLAVQNNVAGFGPDYFDCAKTPTGPACGYNPATRANGPTWADIDYIGVYVKVKHQMLTKLFGSTKVLEAASVIRLEPGQLQ
jgi:hypothetical protein